MYLRDVLTSLLRRWYLVVAALIVTALACVLVLNAIAPTYLMQASVVLVPPKNPDEPGDNSFLQLSGLNQAVDVLTRSLNADKTHEFVRKVTNGQFEVRTDFGTSAPIVVIEAKGSSKAETTKVLDTVLDRVPVNLEELQSALNIAAKSQITSVPLARDTGPQADNKKRLRALAAVAVVMLGASGGIIAAVDGMLLARKYRRSQASGEGFAAEETP